MKSKAAKWNEILLDRARKWSFLLGGLALLIPLLVELIPVGIVSDVFSSFRLNYILVAIAGGGILWFLRWRLLGIFLFGGGLLLLAATFQFAAVPMTHQPGPLKVISYNLYAKNPNKKLVREYIKKQMDYPGDVVVILMEVNPIWAREIATWGLPIGLNRPDDGNFGYAILCKCELVSQTVLDLDDIPIRGIELNINHRGQALAIFGFHPVPPVAVSAYRARNMYLENGFQKAIQANKPTIIAGDFNLVPWSPVFRQFSQKYLQGFSSANAYWLPRITWRAGPFLLTIDHMLFSQQLRLESFDTGPRMGSDHHPLIGTYSLRQPHSISRSQLRDKGAR